MKPYLAHIDDPCTGEWRLHGRGTDRRVRCDRCCASYPASPEYRLAAINENYAGFLLRRLADEGRGFGPVKRMS